MFYLILT